MFGVLVLRWSFSSKHCSSLDRGQGTEVMTVGMITYNTFLQAWRKGYKSAIHHLATNLTPKVPLFRRMVEKCYSFVGQGFQCKTNKVCRPLKDVLYKSERNYLQNGGCSQTVYLEP